MKNYFRTVAVARDASKATQKQSRRFVAALNYSMKCFADRGRRCQKYQPDGFVVLAIENRNSRDEADGKLVMLFRGLEINAFKCNKLNSVSEEGKRKLFAAINCKSFSLRRVQVERSGLLDGTKQMWLSGLWGVIAASRIWNLGKIMQTLKLDSIEFSSNPHPLAEFFIMESFFFAFVFYFFQ